MIFCFLSRLPVAPAPATSVILTTYHDFGLLWWVICPVCPTQSRDITSLGWARTGGGGRWGGLGGGWGGLGGGWSGFVRTPGPGRSTPPRPVCTDHANWNRLHSRRAQRAALRESARSGMTFGDMATQRRRGRRVAGWVALTLAVIVTLAVLGAYWKFRSLWTSISHVTVGDLGKRPPQYNPKALNLLVFASGSTAGLTRKQQLYWHVGRDAEDAVSETLMIVHVST